MKYRKTILFDRRNGEVAGVAEHDLGDAQRSAYTPRQVPFEAKDVPDDPGPTRNWAEIIAQEPERFAMIGADAIISAQELRDRRKALEMTQETLAGILGKSKSIVEKMESDSPSGVPVTGSVAVHIDQVLKQLEGSQV